MIKKAAWILFVTSLAVPAAADVEVQFYGNNGDSFIIANIDACPLIDSTIEIDLSPTLGGVFFDVSEASPGYQRSRPFELSVGEEYLEEVPEVKDGDTSIVFKVKDLPGDGIIRFTLDTDFTKMGSGAHVYTSLVEGGLVRISYAEAVTFDEDGYANVPVGACVS